MTILIAILHIQNVWAFLENFDLDIALPNSQLDLTLALQGASYASLYLVIILACSPFGLCSRPTLLLEIVNLPFES